MTYERLKPSGAMTEFTTLSVVMIVSFMAKSILQGPENDHQEHTADEREPLLVLVGTATASWLAAKTR